MRSILILGAVFMLATAPAREVLAQSDDNGLEAYRALVARAADDFREQRFAAARRAFLAAYDIHPEPVLLYNVASTLRHEGKDRQALSFYQRFLDLAPHDHARRAAARGYVEELSARLDGEEGAETGDEQLAGIDRTDAPRSPRAGRRERLSGIGIAVAGGVLIGVAIQQRREARSIADELAALPAGTPWTDELDDRYADSQSADRRALILTLVGTTAAAAGAILYVVGERRRRRSRTSQGGTRPELSLHPDLVRGGWRVGLALQF